MAVMALCETLNSEYHVKFPFSLNGGCIVHMVCTVEKTQSLSWFILAHCRCGLNLWVRKMEIDGEKIDQIMYTVED